jgi:hypothetical protein
MRRWAIRVAQLLSLLWATLFLTANLLHPLTHNPLQHDGSDCLVCVLHKTASAEPPTAQLTWRVTLPTGAPIALPAEPTAPPRQLESATRVPKSPAHPLPNLPVSFTTRAASARTPFTL